MADNLDGDVLRRFVAGDREAFEVLYGRFHRDVYRWILRIVRDPAAADDALVEAFWRAYRGRARFEASRSFGAWMRRIATNAALDQLRGRSVHAAPQDIAELIASPQPDADIRRHVSQAVGALSPKLR